MRKIEKTAAGTYKTSVFTGRNALGKQMFEHVTRPTWHECRNVALEIEKQVKDKTYSSKSGMKASAAFDEWWKLNEERLSPTTRRMYKVYIKRFKAAMGHYKLNRITDTIVETFLNTLRTGGNLGEEIIKKQSETTILKQYSVLNLILGKYLKTQNPCIEIEAPKKQKSPRTILTKKQFIILRQRVKGSFDEIPILLAAGCGMRLGEIFGLTWGNIDFDNGIIHITQSMVKIGPQQYVIKAPKSNSGIRDIIANDEVLALIKAYKEQISAQTKIPPFNQLLFGENDKPDRLSKRYETIIENLGFAHTRFHDLRHYRATRLLSIAPDIFVQEQMGHADIATTKAYQHNTDDIVSSVKKKVQKLL